MAMSVKMSAIIQKAVILLSCVCVLRSALFLRFIFLQSLCILAAPVSFKTLLHQLCAKSRLCREKADQ